MSATFGYDRAVKYYDQSRSLPSDVMEVMTEMVADEVGRGKCLEIAIGSGRMANPLSQYGVSIVGVDLSFRMLLRCEKGVPVAQASATSLPFPDNRFDVGVACLALHVIPDWPVAVQELLRVVRPGGILLVSPPWAWDCPISGKLRRFFAKQAGLAAPVPGLQNLEELDEWMGRRGIKGEELLRLSFTYRSSLADIISALERREHAWVWPIPDEAMEPALAATRQWAKDQFGSLEEVRDLVTPLRWRKYRIPA